MLHYVSLLALGDNLISLSLLAQVDKKVSILGTKHTVNIAKMMGLESSFDIEVIFDTIPAFYDIKKQGVSRAIKDFLKFVRYLTKHNIKQIILEKKDVRSFLITAFSGSKSLNIGFSGLKAYEGKKLLIEKSCNAKIDLHSYKLELKRTKIIVINPSTRSEYRNIKYNHLSFILDLLEFYNYEIYLIDIDNKHSKLQNRVYKYLTNTTLDEVKQLISSCDLYIGGDSFLIHLAYYLQKNYFMIFYRDNDDFAPPNIADNFYIKAHNSNNFELEINQKFKNIGLLE